MDCWPPLEVTWFPKKQILGNFSQEEHLQLKALLASFPHPSPPEHSSLVWKVTVKPFTPPVEKHLLTHPFCL